MAKTLPLKTAMNGASVGDYIGTARWHAILACKIMQDLCDVSDDVSFDQLDDIITYLGDARNELLDVLNHACNQGLLTLDD